eukprot:jgi/Botrbrau1/10670/Bobra.139_2s0001.1
MQRTPAYTCSRIIRHGSNPNFISAPTQEHMFLIMYHAHRRHVDNHHLTQLARTHPRQPRPCVTVPFLYHTFPYTPQEPAQPPYHTPPPRLRKTNFHSRNATSSTLPGLHHPPSLTPPPTYLCPSTSPCFQPPTPSIPHFPDTPLRPSPHIHLPPKHQPCPPQHPETCHNTPSNSCMCYAQLAHKTPRALHCCQPQDNLYTTTGAGTVCAYLRMCPARTYTLCPSHLIPSLPSSRAADPSPTPPCSPFVSRSAPHHLSEAARTVSPEAPPPSPWDAYLFEDLFSEAVHFLLTVLLRCGQRARLLCGRPRLRMLFLAPCLPDPHIPRPYTTPGEGKCHSIRLLLTQMETKAAFDRPSVAKPRKRAPSESAFALGSGLGHKFGLDLGVAGYLLLHRCFWIRLALPIWRFGKETSKMMMRGRGDGRQHNAIAKCHWHELQSYISLFL